MIDPSAPFASGFLWLTGALFLLLYALPLLFAPLEWARFFRWSLPARSDQKDQNDLTLYFGRCLGAVATAIVMCCFRAAPQPREHRILFELILAAAVLLTLVHVWGALRRQQPWTETAEVALYASVAALTLWVYRDLFL